MGAQVEEHRHSPSKNGLHYTNHREESTVTLLEVDNALQFLKYLIHRGRLDRDLIDLEKMFVFSFSFIIFVITSSLSSFFFFFLDIGFLFLSITRNLQKTSDGK